MWGEDYFVTGEAYIYNINTKWEEWAKKEPPTDKTFDD